ncbi:hypothetical protein EDF62_1034 [Leucobacter luti]|uniref:Secreted protein n=1 Tax=Leucobacter luti TaxID=340320 RepID=A0A4R6S5N9_9MICO|nr:hypothetical protein EDF62_1034 [Leucobacter luti]
MMRAKRKFGIAALIVAGLAFSPMVPTAALADSSQALASDEGVFIPDSGSNSESLLDVTKTADGFTYRLPDGGGPTGGEGGASARAGVGTGCQGAYVLRKVSNYVEWGASNNCTKTPDAKYLPWYITGSLQRAKVGSSTYSSVQGPFKTADRWGKTASMANNFGCLGTTKYKYRVKWEVRYNGLNSGWFYSDVKTIACA